MKSYSQTGDNTTGQTNSSSLVEATQKGRIPFWKGTSKARDHGYHGCPKNMAKGRGGRPKK